MWKFSFLLIQIDTDRALHQTLEPIMRGQGKIATVMTANADGLASPPHCLQQRSSQLWAPHQIAFVRMQDRYCMHTYEEIQTQRIRKETL